MKNFSQFKMIKNDKLLITYLLYLRGASLEGGIRLLKDIFSKKKKYATVKKKDEDVPEGLMVKCPSCKEIYYRKELEKNLLTRSEEHTSELQSRGHLVCRLL